MTMNVRDMAHKPDGGSADLDSWQTDAVVGLAHADAPGGIIGQGLGTWVFIFLYPQLGLEILNIVVLSPVNETHGGTSARGREKRGEDWKTEDEEPEMVTHG